jgi:hypothetical protein
MKGVVLCVLAASLASAQQPAAPPPARRPHVVTKLQGFELTDTSKMEKQTTVAGASRGAKHAVPLAPRLGRVHAARPALSWTAAVASGTTFLVRVYNEDEDVVHEKTVDAQTYLYDGPALRPGKTYYWTVEVTGAAASRSPMTGMQAVDASDRAVIDRELPAEAQDESGHLARMKVFVDHRVWFDALAEADAAIAAAPSSAAAHEARGQLLAQLPALETFAQEEFGRADALARGR